MCFIAPRSPGANGFNYLTNIVSLWKSEKIVPQVSAGQGSVLRPRQAHTQPITQHYFFKISINFLLLSGSPPTSHGQAQTWKNGVLRRYNRFTSFLFFPVTIFLGGWHLVLQANIVISSPIVSQTSELGDL